MPYQLGQGNSRTRSLYRIRNATIQEISHGRNVSYISVSYMPPVPRSTSQDLVLVVNRQTVIRNTYGHVLNRRQLQLGMTIDADVSFAMTASIPPQTTAARITVIPPASAYHTVLGTIMQVNNNPRFILVGTANGPSNLIRLNIFPDTLIRNRRGQQIGFQALRRGQLIRADHSVNQTFSIPPQSAAFRIWVL